jgi:hypothetical protein
MRTCVRGSQGTAYSQFKRALERRNFMLAWTMAAELPKVPLADGLQLLLLARDLEPARFDRAVPRWHARLRRGGMVRRATIPLCSSLRPQSADPLSPQSAENMQNLGYLPQYGESMKL